MAAKCQYDGNLYQGFKVSLSCLYVPPVRCGLSLAISALLPSDEECPIPRRDRVGGCLTSLRGIATLRLTLAVGEGHESAGTPTAVGIGSSFGAFPVSSTEED